MTPSLDASLRATPRFAKALEEYPGFTVRSLAPLRDSDEKPYCIDWADKNYINADFNAMKSLEVCERRGKATLNRDQRALGKLDRRVQNTR